MSVSSASTFLAVWTRFHEVVGNRFWSPIIWVSLLDGIIFIVNVPAPHHKGFHGRPASPPDGGHALGDVERPVRMGKGDLLLLEPPQDLQVDRLLDPQVELVVGLLDEIDALE